MEYAVDRVENIEGKRSKCMSWDFSFFRQCFEKASFWGSFKLFVCAKELNRYQTSKYQTCQYF